MEPPITDLYLDATFLDTRWAGTLEHVAALVAYGVDPDGHRVLLGMTIGAEESEASWAELLEQLIARGLAGVELAIADAHAGLGRALRRLCPMRSISAASFICSATPSRRHRHDCGLARHERRPTSSSRRAATRRGSAWGSSRAQGNARDAGP